MAESKSDLLDAALQDSKVLSALEEYLQERIPVLERGVEELVSDCSKKDQRRILNESPESVRGTLARWAARKGQLVELRLLQIKLRDLIRERALSED